MPNTRIQGNLAVTINSTIAGDCTVNGNSKIKGNLCVQGWLDAQNLRTPCKGLFSSADSLQEAYPHPGPGWWALVGATLPATVYTERLGRWTTTEATAGNISIDLDAYDKKISDINQSISALSTAVKEVAEHPVTIVDTSTADFIVADEKGTALLTVANGHIRTALFDSADISSGGSTPAHRLRGKRLSIVGDSISTFSGHIPAGYLSFYPSGNISAVEHTWWHQVVEATGMKLLRNCSWSGSLLCGSESQAASETSAQCGCSQRRVADLADSSDVPDVVIIWMGINDWGHASVYGYPLGTFDPAKDIPATDCFCGAYATVIKKVTTAYPSAEVYCCTLLTSTAKWSSMPSNSYPYINGNGVPLARYNEAIRAIAQMCGVGVISLDQCGFTPWNNSLFTLDGLHPNAKGAAKIAKEIIKALN